MTTPVSAPPDFVRRLRSAMARRDLNSPQLGRLAGCEPSYVRAMRLGRKVPSLALALRMADALDWPSLAEAARAPRERRCVVCAAPFILANRGNARRFCSAACRVASGKRRRRASEPLPGVVERHRLTIYQDAVAAFCLSCTDGEMVCRDGACPLRPVSPAPHVPLTAASLRRVG